MPEVPVGAFTLAVPPAGTFIGVCTVPFMLYVTETGRVVGFVNVTEGDAAFWQTDAVPDIVADGVGLTVTVVDDWAEGPLHPAAETEMVATPVKPGAQVTVPVDPVPAIVLPDPLTFQMYDVALSANVVNAVDAVP